MQTVNWHDDSNFDVAGRKFKCCNTLEDFHQPPYKGGHVVGKTTNMLEVTIDKLADLKPETLVELGVLRGGSAIFFHALCQPRKMLTVDINGPVKDLEQYKDSLSDDSLVTASNLSQSDTEKLPEVVANTFGGEGIDCVIDDASHDYGHTRASFNMLFPLMRPNGYYIIEDWAWGYDARIMPKKYVDKTEPLIRLAFELVTFAARCPGIASEVSFNRHHIVIKRGDEELAPASFDYQSLYELKPETYL